MTLPDTVKSYSEHAAEAFIQTAVFIDDRLYENTPRGSDEPKSVVSPETRKKARKTAEGTEAVVASAPETDTDDNATPDATEASAPETDTNDDTTPDAYDIVNSFAKKQIVCSLYQPKRTAKVSPKSDIFSLCKASDIVIIDWDLHGDHGKRAIELADGLISQAVKAAPEQLRLILIYTGELDLFEIAKNLHEKVSETLGDSFTLETKDDGLSFHTDNSRVVVLGKPGRTRSTEVKKSFVVKEENLAEIAVREFSRLASGLLHAASLRGLAEIRKNSRKILSNFNQDLDPGFLTHLALSLPREDASTHIVPLLVSEIEAVLEDVLPHPLIPKKVLEDWVDNVWKPGDHLDKQNGIDYYRVAKDLLTTGFKEAINPNKKLDIPNPNAEKNRTKKTRKAAQILLPSEESTSNQKFARLMASRTFYDNKPKSLRLGSIVQQDNSSKYFLCIQPICDSVRVENEQVFVFVSMQFGKGGESDHVSHVILKSDDTFQELFYDPKSYHCFTATFAPQKNAEEVLVEDDPQSGRPVFTATDGKKYFWVDQLKTGHAQRAVEQFASNLSRVGLTESEWLRRLSGR